MAIARPFTIEVDDRSYLIRTTPAGYAYRDEDGLFVSLNIGVLRTKWRNGRRFCRRHKALRDRDICPCRNMSEHDHRVFVFDDWGAGPQCVECGRFKIEVS